MRWKRMFMAAFVAGLLCAALCVGAGASGYDDAARDLSAIGMFRGTAKGFELDRAPTRSEAAIMLVRLYGAEEGAKADYEAGKISHPFTDVSAFTTPYVAYLYANGLTKGTSATTFGSGSPCTLTNYAVFLLRALGYRDGEDFQYREALAFAREKLLETSDLNAEPFLRGHLAELTRRALGLELKDGSATLLDSLISSGAIDGEAAAPLKIRRSAFSIPTGGAFGLTGENAVLYTAAAKYLYEKYDSVLSETGTLLIPAVTVYGKYAADGGGTHYVCGLSELWFYDMGLATNVNADSLRNEQVGSGGGPVRITLDGNGVCVNITEYPDGDAPEGRLRYIREICGPLTDLVSAIANDTATGKKLTPDGWKATFNAYLRYFYPQYYREA
ncbi:MAG: hypothetical protein IJK52_02335 [Oscillospiraceae bacterium]|nr:hypothetical protein [Oscillospiraceae bacterium]